MERVITDSDKEKIINLGALGYPYADCAIVLGWDSVEDVPGFNELYERGQVRSQYVIDLKLFELASSGDVKAIEALERRKRKRERDAKKKKQV